MPAVPVVSLPRWPAPSAAPTDANDFDRVLLRVRNAFEQLPTLSLTPDEGRLRWQVDAATCRQAFQTLRAIDYLVETPDGHFARRDVCFH